MSFVSVVLEIDNFSIFCGSLKSVRVHVLLLLLFPEFAKALVPGTGIPFRAGYV